MKVNDLYTIYKTKVGPVRKDGSRKVQTYGCNGHEHRIQYDALWCDDKGQNVTMGKSHIKPDKVIGPCPHNNTCKNYGSFILM